MTGQIIIEVEGKGIKKVTIKGDVKARNINLIDRKVRKEWRRYQHLKNKEAMKRHKERAKPELPLAVPQISKPGQRIPGMTEPRTAPNPMLSVGSGLDAPEPIQPAADTQPPKVAAPVAITLADIKKNRTKTSDIEEPKND